LLARGCAVEGFHKIRVSDARPLRRALLQLDGSAQMPDDPFRHAMLAVSESERDGFGQTRAGIDVRIDFVHVIEMDDHSPGTGRVAETTGESGTAQFGKYSMCLNLYLMANYLHNQVRPILRAARFVHLNQRVHKKLPVHV
jgi:hypothetical protein